MHLVQNRNTIPFFGLVSRAHAKLEAVVQKGNATPYPFQMALLWYSMFWRHIVSNTKIEKISTYIYYLFMSKKGIKSIYCNHIFFILNDEKPNRSYLLVMLLIYFQHCFSWVGWLRNGHGGKLIYNIFMLTILVIQSGQINYLCFFSLFWSFLAFVYYQRFGASRPCNHFVRIFQILTNNQKWFGFKIKSKNIIKTSAYSSR